MTYNTMCDFCKGSDFFDYDKRAKKLKDKIGKYKADIISLQEVRSAAQLRQLIPHKNYKYITNESMLISFADPSILYRPTKLTLIKDGNFWLGPNEGKLSTGWKFAVPRQVQWGLFKINKTDQLFYFIASHFDNRIENLTGSAKMLNEFIKKLKHPVIFAADTNMTVDMVEYKALTKSLLLNSFDIKSSFKLYGAYKDDKDVCYLKKGKSFPECRVDHILLDQRHKWKVEKYIIDITKNFEKKFPSDHRPVIIDLNYQGVQ